MKKVIILFLLAVSMTPVYSNGVVTLKLINYIPLPANPVDLAVNDNFAYVCLSNGNRGVIAVIDLTNPMEIPAYRMYERYADNPKAITSSGSFGYIADNNNTIRVLNFNNSIAPSSYGDVRTSGNVNAMFAAGDYLYAAVKDFGLQAYDISLRSMPLIKNNQMTSGNPTDVFADEKYVYITTDNGNLTIFDISDISNITSAGKYNLGFNYYGVYASNGYVYIAQGINGVQVIDANKLPNPKNVTLIYTKRNSIDVKVNDEYTWVNDELTLQAYYNKDVKNQTYAGSYDNMGAKINKFNITADGKYVYICSDDNQLKILKAEYRN
jgi:hypothetical protein